jgi:hypothetical protein
MHSSLLSSQDPQHLVEAFLEALGSSMERVKDFRRSVYSAMELIL